MNKNFKFKLEGLRKIREFKEKTIKIEIGQIVQQITQIKDEIKQVQNDIEQGRDEQEAMLNKITSVKTLQFFPYYFSGKKAHIESLETKLWGVEKKYNEKIEELKIARGESKVIENIKEKKTIEHNKKYEKKQQAIREEMTLIRRAYEK